VGQLSVGDLGQNYSGANTVVAEVVSGMTSLLQKNHLAASRFARAWHV
jgi:hypothetical protein